MAGEKAKRTLAGVLIGIAVLLGACTSGATAEPAPPSRGTSAAPVSAPNTAPSSASPQPAPPTSTRRVEEYLALGDSGPFGTDPTVTAAGKGGDPSNFVGYPEMLASLLGLRLTNAACPGETTGSFISISVTSECGVYRRTYPLKVDLGGRSQLEFALAHLRTHPATTLVTISIGGNDVGALLGRCAGDAECIKAGYPSVLDSIRANLHTIHSRLRSEGLYQGRVVAVFGAPLDFRDPGSVERTTAFNAVVGSVATAYPGGLVADIFTVFKAASGPGLDQCAAGLRVVLSADPLRCDAHHSRRGRELTANAIRDALTGR